ncbi:MAG: MoaD/ThiS family protein [Alphaproteobacteria bacterium]|nr:MoaD/ThiS family protein [Alphaproteobacteria bacterium]
MKILYFASVREAIGLEGETVEPPEGVDTPRKLAEWLRSRSEAHGRAFEDLSAVRAAVDMKVRFLDEPLGEAESVAFFPPMTGGAR